MKLLQKLLNKEPENGQYTSQLLPLLQPAWTPATFRHLVRQGYMRNVIVYRCVHLIKQGISSVPWQLAEPPKNSAAQKGLFLYLKELLDQPNPYSSWASFVNNLTMHMLLAGNAFIKVVKNEAGQPVALYNLNPNRINVRIQNNEPVYEVQEGNRRMTYHAHGDNVGILHLKFPHPLHDTEGLSPLEVCRDSVDQHNAVAAHNVAIIQNGGRPSGALIWKHETNLTEEQRRDIQQQLRRSIEGNQNAGRVLLMEGNFEWKEMGLSPKDLDFSEGKHVAAREIAMSFGVPPLLAGVPGESTYSNYKEARLHLWEETLLPLLNFLQKEFALYFSESCGAKVAFTYDINAIPALVQKRRALWERLSAASFLTANEKRQALGYPPLKNGDKLEGATHAK